MLIKGSIISILRLNGGIKTVPFAFQEITADLELTDISGKKLDALTVFSRTIEFFRYHLMTAISNENPSIKDKQIGWVITVPAIWCDSAKKT